ncbi:MAG: hypothetical protein SGBAC_012750 [Bacillariaceae sp.]
MGNWFSGKGFCNEGTTSSTGKSSQAAFSEEATKHIKLLFGCQNAKEHLEYVEEMCDLIADKHGEEGLAVLGLEFRYIADNLVDSQFKSNSMSSSTTSSSKRSQQTRFSPEEEEKKTQGDEISIPIQDGETDHAPDHISISDDSISDSKRSTSKNKSKRYQHAVSDLSYGGSDSNSNNNSNDENDDEGSISDEEKEISFAIRQMSIEKRTEFLVPVGEPISRVNSSNDLGFGVRQGSERSVQTTTTMFSLSTHQSRASTTASTKSLEKPIAHSGYLLFHKSSNTLISDKNHQLYIAHGKMYDEVARLCMEYAQDLMMKEGNLEWQSLGDGINAMVTRNRSFQRPLLLIVTGKGKVGAGIFSRRHLMIGGVETATALPFVQGAIQRNMDMAILDPNGGATSAMQSVETSLNKLFLQHGATEEDVYILAHSMAGSQIVRFLHNKTFDKNTIPPKEGKAAIPDTSQEFQTQSGKNLLNQVKAFAFTDSNHNINWTKHNRPLKDLIEGPSSLYIKSHKVHEDDKKLGELHHDCDFWKHRFGNIKTIWGGTHEHALTNFTGMQYIWDHFDDILDEQLGGEDDQ